MEPTGVRDITPDVIEAEAYDMTAGESALSFEQLMASLEAEFNLSALDEFRLAQYRAAAQRGWSNARRDRQGEDSLQSFMNYIRTD